MFLQRFLQTSHLLLNMRMTFQMSSQQQQLKPLNVLSMRLDQAILSSSSPQGQTQSQQPFTEVQKYLIVKRKSVLTGGKIPELKGIQVKELLQNSKNCIVRQMNLTKNIQNHANVSSSSKLNAISPSELVELLLLDHSILKFQQTALLNYIINTPMRPEQLLFLFKSALFSGMDQSSRGLLSACLTKVFKEFDYLSQSPFGLTYLLLVFYETLRETHGLHDKEKTVFFISREQLLKFEGLLKKSLNMQDVIPKDMLFYEYCIDKFLECPNLSNTSVCLFIENLIYFGQFMDVARLDKLFNAFNANNPINLPQLIHLLTCTTSKNLPVTSAIYQRFILYLTEEISRETPQKVPESSSVEPISTNSIPQIRSNSIPKSDELLKYVNGNEIEKQLEFTEDDQLDLSNRVECLWILTRNYQSSEQQLIDSLLTCTLKELTRLQIRQLLSLLQCLVALDMQQNLDFLETPSQYELLHNQYADSYKQLLSHLLQRIKTSSIPLTPKQKCSLFLHINYLISGKRINAKLISEGFWNDIFNCYHRLTLGKEGGSKTEQIFERALRDLSKNNLIRECTIKPGALINQIYYVDFLIEPGNCIVEINGDLHHNKQTKALFRHNYLLKLFYLRFRRFQVSVMHPQEYLPAIKDQVQLQNLVLEKLPNLKQIQ